MPGWMTTSTAYYMSGETVLWNQLLQSYVKSNQVFLCPGDSSPDAPVTSWANPAPVSFPKPYKTSYLYNFSFSQLGGSPGWVGIPLPNVQKPASTVILCDGGAQAETTAPWVKEKGKEKPSAWLLQDPAGGWFPTLPGDSNNGDWAAPAIRHSGFINVGFVDGHAKALKAETFYYGNSPWLDPSRGG